MAEESKKLVESSTDTSTGISETEHSKTIDSYTDTEKDVSGQVKEEKPKKEEAPTYADTSTDTEEDLNKETSKMIINIEQKLILSLKLKITYFDNVERINILNEGDIVKIRAISDKQLKEYKGKIKSIKVVDDNKHIIELDCGQEYHSNIEYIHADMIRSVEIL